MKQKAWLDNNNPHSHRRANIIMPAICTGHCAPQRDVHMHMAFTPSKICEFLLPIYRQNGMEALSNQTLFLLFHNVQSGP